MKAAEMVTTYTAVELHEVHRCVLDEFSYAATII